MKPTILIPAMTLAATVFGATCLAPGNYRSSDPEAEQNFQRGVAYFNQKEYRAANYYLGLAAQRNHPRAEELLGSGRATCSVTAYSRG